ncbi:MAG TPA: cobalamin-dependent protein [Polyangiaceae bacterium]
MSRPVRRPRRAARAGRIVTAVPLCDGHDSAITTINLELVRKGWEVIYLGYHQPASAIARAAVQEDADAIGLSSYNGGHVVFFRQVLAELRARGARDVLLFGGGGGTITASDARVLERAGVKRIFFAGTPLEEMVETVTREQARRRPSERGLRGDRALARAVTLAENGSKPGPSPARSRRRALTIGFAGPGGAGKSTLIDELVARFLRNQPAARAAVLANDPSHPDGGALLGDRVSAIYSQDERVFFRSLATRGSLSGISSTAPRALDVLRHSGAFDLVLVESVGIGQESDPFGVFGRNPCVDVVAFVLSPHYGGRIQLQKIALLDAADFVVLNKCDDPRAASAKAELAARLSARRRPAATVVCSAAEHADPGVDALYAALAGVERGGA